jgi:hypothetical protein
LVAHFDECSPDVTLRLWVHFSETLLLAHLTLTILYNGFQMRKLCPSQIKEIQKKKSSNTTKTSSQKPKKTFICYSIVIKVERWFVEF